MRGGRNKFGPMYKRDRARKLQMLRQRQLALQTLRGSLGDPSSYSSSVTPFLHIKQEIQIPQVSSLTSSPDSSPSPAAVAAANMVTTQAGSGGGGGGGGAGQHQLIAPSTQSSITGGGGGGNNHLHNNSATTSLDSKLWAANSTTSSPKAFNFGEQSTQGSGQPGGGGGQNNAATSTATTLKTSPMIRDFVQSVDDREWQASLFGLLQNQTYNQCEVDLFELMCKVLDQNLFSQVDWARNSVFFKDLKVGLLFTYYYYYYYYLLVVVVVVQNKRLITRANEYISLCVCISSSRRNVKSQNVYFFFSIKYRFNCI